MKMGFTMAAALLMLTACGTEHRKVEPAAPVTEQTSTPVATPDPVQVPATPTAPAPTTTTPSTPTTTPTPEPTTTAALDCSDMQAILQAMMNGSDPQQIAQQCMGSLGGAGGLPNIPGLPTGGNTP